MDLTEVHAQYKEAHAKVVGIAMDLAKLLDQGTEEAGAKALSRKPELDAAQDEEFGLYVALLKEPGGIDLLTKQNISPATWQPGKTIILRSVFDTLSVQEKSDFIRSGGRLV